MEKLLSIGEAAKVLNVSSETLRRWDKSGKFQSSRHPINNYRVYPESTVLTLVEDLQVDYDTQLSDLGTPYYNTELGSLFNVDAVEFLKSIPSNSVDLVFAKTKSTLFEGCLLYTSPSPRDS